MRAEKTLAQPQLPDPGVKAGIFRFSPPAGSSSHAILSGLARVNASVAVGALLFVNSNPRLGSVESADWEQRIRNLGQFDTAVQMRSWLGKKVHDWFPEEAEWLVDALLEYQANARGMVLCLHLLGLCCAEAVGE